jgi:hypothetical protein
MVMLLGALNEVVPLDGPTIHVLFNSNGLGMAIISRL